MAAALVCYDRCKGKNTRQWEYGCLFLVGILGAMYGALNDAVTFRLSPDYFTFGKGLDAEVASPTLDAMRLGAEAGFSAAVVACAVWQFILRRTPAPNRCRLILRWVWLPLVSAAAFSLAMPAAFGRLDPMAYSSHLAGLISKARIAAFLVVWWAHIGVYTGFCVGLAAAIRSTIKVGPRSHS